MKPKVIAIVIAVVITTGTATGVGVAVSRNNDKQTEELVSAAVSEALATVESTTIENTTESTTEVTTAESTTAKTVQKAPKQETTTEEPQVAYDDKSDAPVKIENELPPNDDRENFEVNTPIGTIKKSEHNKRQDDLGYYWLTNYTYSPDPDNGKYYHYCLDENDTIFYFDENNNRVYPKF